MTLLIYVEGDSDRHVMNELLIELRRKATGSQIRTNVFRAGDNRRLMDQSPRTAAAHLNQHAHDWAVIVPDLYRMRPFASTEFRHSSITELRSVIQNKVRDYAKTQGWQVDPILDRLKIHCFKFDLESLLLAVTDRLRKRLQTTHRLAGRWKDPVEDQNDDHPPKSIVEGLFLQYRNRAYVATSDAPEILRGADVEELARICPQGFGPLVADIKSIMSLGS